MEGRATITPCESKILLKNSFNNESLIVLIGLLNSFRDGNELRLRHWTSLTLLCWFVAALGLKEPSQPSEIIPFIFHFINSRFFFRHGLLHCWLPVTWLNTIWLNIFVESFGLKILGQVTTKLSQLHSNSRNKNVNSRKYHNVGHMRCIHARPHRRKDQLLLRSLRDLRSR